MEGIRGHRSGYVSGSYNVGVQGARNAQQRNLQQRGLLMGAANDQFVKRAPEQKMAVQFGGARDAHESREDVDSVQLKLQQLAEDEKQELKGVSDKQAIKAINARYDRQREILKAQESDYRDDLAEAQEDEQDEKNRLMGL